MSKNHSRQIDDKSGFYQSQVFSYHSGLPLVASYLSRASLTESKKIMQIFSSFLSDRKYKNDILSDKKFLLFKSKGTLTENEQKVISKGNLLYQNQYYELLAIDPIDLFMYDSTYIDVYNRIRDSLFLTKRDFLVNDTSLFFDFYNTNQNKPILEFTKDNFSSGKKSEYNILYKDKSKFDHNRIYNVSFWYYNNAKQINNNILVVSEINKKGKSKWTTKSSISKSFNIYDEWSLISVDFKIKKETDMVSIFLKGGWRDEQTIYYNEILVRDKGLNVYKTLPDSALFYNNFRTNIKY